MSLAAVRSLVEARLQFLETVAPLYVFRPLLNADELRAWMRECKFPVSVPDMHVTIVYSNSPMSWTVVPPQRNTLRVPGGLRRIEVFGEGATVLAFASRVLQDRWQQFMDAGASFDHDSYRPHVTLTYEDASAVLHTKPFTGDLYFGPEVYEAVDP